jgi:hypothetical protein
MCLLALSNPDEATAPAEWQLVKNTEGVQTYFRWTTNDAGASYRERKGEMNIHCTLQEAASFISDAGSTAKWMASIDECYDLSRISRNEWYTYTLFSIPWPLSKRDLISYNQLHTDPAKGSVMINIICKDKYVPEKPGITRLTDYKAYWKITQTDDSNIKVVFNAASSARPTFPRYIQDPIIEKIFHNNLIRLREALNKPVS